MASNDGGPGFDDVENKVASKADVIRSVLGLDDIMDATWKMVKLETVVAQINSNSIQESKHLGKDSNDIINSITRTKIANFSYNDNIEKLLRITQHLKPFGLVFENRHAENVENKVQQPPRF